MLVCAHTVAFATGLPALSRKTPRTVATDCRVTVTARPVRTESTPMQ